MAAHPITRRVSWYVYILLCRDSTLYTGIARDLESRLRKHQSGKGAKYTRGRGVEEIVYSKRYVSRSKASQQEAAIKKLTRKLKLDLIRNQGK